MFRKLPIALLALISCASPPHPERVEDLTIAHAHFYEAPRVPEMQQLEVERASLDLPDTCDRLLVVDTPSGPQLSKERPTWLRDGRARWQHQLELRELVRVVGEELGADELAIEMVWRKAILESSGNPSAVHIHSADLAANRRAARRGRERSSERWARARVPVYRRTKRGLVQVGERDAWALGRGLYGMVTGLHAWRWSTDAPPWSLCDPLVATVTAFWAMRAGLAECRGTTLRDAYRRFSSGKCAERSEDRERAFDRLARGSVRGLKLRWFNPDAPARFGSRWPEQTADRGELLAKLRRRRKK